VSERRSLVGAGRSVDRWRLVAERRQTPPPDLPEGVEMLDVAMAEYVVAVRREPFSGLYDQPS
jgi:hypothetical protein